MAAINFIISQQKPYRDRKHRLTISLKHLVTVYWVSHKNVHDLSVKINLCTGLEYTVYCINFEVIA